MSIFAEISVHSSGLGTSWYLVRAGVGCPALSVEIRVSTGVCGEYVGKLSRDRGYSSLGFPLCIECVLDLEHCGRFLPVEAFGIDGEQHCHLVARPLGDLYRCTASVESGGQAGMSQVVWALREQLLGVALFDGGASLVVTMHVLVLWPFTVHIGSTYGRAPMVEHSFPRVDMWFGTPSVRGFCPGGASRQVL